MQHSAPFSTDEEAVHGQTVGPSHLCLRNTLGLIWWGCDKTFQRRRQTALLGLDPMTLSNALPRRLHHLQQELCWDYQCNINPNADEVCNPLSSESPVSWQTSQQFSYSRARASPAVVFHWAFSSLPPWLRGSSVPQHTEDPATGSLVLTISLPVVGSGLLAGLWCSAFSLYPSYSHGLDDPLPVHRVCFLWCPPGYLIGLIFIQPPQASFDWDDLKIWIREQFLCRWHADLCEVYS